MKILAIYDNGGKTFDRYSIYFDIVEKTKNNNNFYLCLGMSENPFHPQGFCQHSSGMLGSFNGNRISFSSLPLDCQNALIHLYKITNIQELKNNSYRIGTK